MPVRAERGAASASSSSRGEGFFGKQALLKLSDFRYPFESAKGRATTFLGVGDALLRNTASLDSVFH